MCIKGPIYYPFPDLYFSFEMKKDDTLKESGGSSVSVKVYFFTLFVNISNSLFLEI